MTLTPKTAIRSLSRSMNTFLRGETRILLVSLGISLSSFQTGYDNVVMAGFQGMQGFLAVFGYKDVSFEPVNRTSKKLEC